LASNKNKKTATKVHPYLEIIKFLRKTFFFLHFAKVASTFHKPNTLLSLAKKKMFTSFYLLYHRGFWKDLLQYTLNFNNFKYVKVLAYSYRE
jgi:hypothetical protein